MPTKAQPIWTALRQNRQLRWRFARCCGALLLAGLAFIVRYSLNPYLGTLQPFSLFYVALVAAVWFGGAKCGAIVGFFGLFLGWFFFLPPAESFRIGTLADGMQISTYCFVAAAIVFLVQRIRDAELNASAAAETALAQKAEADAHLVQRKSAEDALRAAKEELTRSNETLEKLVEKRTAELQATNERLREEIAQHQKTGHELRATEERFRLLVEGIKDYAIYLLDRSGRVMTWNTGAQRLKGYHADEIIGRHFSEFYTEDEIRANKPEQHLALAADHGSWVDEGWRVRKNGTRFWASVTITAVRDPSGALIGYAKITGDMTERRRMEQKLRDTIAELEHFSYSITHDMRAPLRAMQGFAELLEREPGNELNERGRDFLRRIRISADRMDSLIRDALNYSKIAREQFQLLPVQPSGLLRGIVESYPELESHRSDIEIQENIPTVLGNQAAMTQCFSNLLGNAIKFARLDVTPQIRVWGEPRNGFIRVWVEDNGVGIPAEHQERVFKMFQQLNGNREGTGIGLAIARKAIERLGGKVGLESAPGHGSRFWVELKKAE